MTGFRSHRSRSYCVPFESNEALSRRLCSFLTVVAFLDIKFDLLHYVSTRSNKSYSAKKRATS